MVQNNKILTVSYGTFSCTLEGFEDSFETMKAIAEYFRDLSSDDRYFGSEPPQPDTEMLSRIAQRDIKRHVHAHEDDQGYHLRAETPQPAKQIAAAAPMAAPQPQPAPAEAANGYIPGEGIADKLERIRAVVSPQQQPAPQQVAYSEDEHAEDFAEAPSAGLAAALAQDVAPDPQPEPEVIAEEPEVDVTEDAEVEAVAEAVAEPISEDAQDDEPEAETAVDHIEFDLTQAEDADVAAEDTVAQDEPAAEDADEAAEADVVVEEVAETSDEPTAEKVEEVAEPAAAPFMLTPQERVEDEKDETESLLASIVSQAASDIDSADEAEQPAPEAHILRVKKADLDEVVANGTLEEVQDDDGQPELQSTLSDEDETDLLKELAAVEAEFAEDDAPEVTAENEDASTGKTEDDLDRLMATAAEKMGEAHSTETRESYGHMRTAVAAKQAGIAVSGDDSDAVDSYRADLADAVRPAAKEAASPLKLVAEQRVDEEEVEATGEEGGFKAFASEMGATELPELLEAAASYLSFVEGRDQFSRPQLMHKVRQVETGEFNREDGLRSFGQLLREGKIEKTGGGRFTASGDIGYRPDARAVG